MKKKTKTKLLVKALSSEKRVKILFTIDSHGPLRFSELKEKMNIKSPGELSYHLSLLREVDMIGLDCSYGQRRYTLTSLGKETVELLKRLEGGLLKQELGVYIVDEYGLAFKYDTLILTDKLKEEYGIRGRHLRRIYSDVEGALSELNRVFYEEFELDQIILSTLLKNNLADYLTDNTYIGFRKRELDKSLSKEEEFAEVDEKIRRRVLTSYNLFYRIPENVKAFIRNGIFYISYIHEWIFKGNTLILDATQIKGNSYPLNFYNVLLFTWKYAHSLFFRKFNNALYDMHAHQGVHGVEDFLSKIFKALTLIWDNLKYERIAVEILVEKNSELGDFNRILLNRIELEEKYRGPPLIINVKNRKAVEELYDLIYNLTKKHVPLTLVNNTGKEELVAAIPHVQRIEDYKGITVIENSFNLLLPVLALFSRKDKAIAEDFLKNMFTCISELINEKRKYFQRIAPLRKLHKIPGYMDNSVNLVNTFSILGGEMATRILLGTDLKDTDSVIRLLKNFIKELEDLREKITISYTSSDISLYEIGFRALTYRAEEFNVQLPPFEHFNLLSPFSKTHRELGRRIAGESQLFEETGVPSIFTLDFTDPFPAFENFKALLSKLLDSNVKVVNLSYDFTECEYCGYKTSRYADTCPNCLSVKPYIIHYGRVIADYRPLDRIPKIAKNEYLRRFRINDVILRKELPSI